MNSKEIMEKTFKKSGMSGYKIDEVDIFLSEIGQEMDKLVAENDDFKNKLSILASKLEEYKKDEQSLRDALIGAQKLGANIVNEAKSKAEKLILDAKFQSENLLKESQDNAVKTIHNIKIQIEKEQQSLARIQKEVSNFKSKLLSIYKSHLDLITTMPEIQVNESETKEEIYENKFEDINKFDNKREIKENLSKTQQILKEKLAETQQIKIETEKKEPKNETSSFESKFGELKFGQNTGKI